MTAFGASLHVLSLDTFFDRYRELSRWWRTNSTKIKLIFDVLFSLESLWIKRHSLRTLLKQLRELKPQNVDKCSVSQNFGLGRVFVSPSEQLQLRPPGSAQSTDPSESKTNAALIEFLFEYTEALVADTSFDSTRKRTSACAVRMRVNTVPQVRAKHFLKEMYHLILQ